MTKAEEREIRIRNAKRRDLPQLIFCVSIAIFNRWLHQGERVLDTTYAPVDMDEKTLAKIRKRITKVEKYRDACIKNLNWDNILSVKKNGQDNISNAFHRSTTEMVNLWINTILKYMPDITVTDTNRVLTYLIHMAMYDLVRLYEWHSQESRYLIMTSTTLANEMIPADSGLILLLNEVYWECRDETMVYPDWQDFPFDGPTDAEVYAQTEDTPLAKAMRQWRDSTPKSIMRIAS